MYSPQTYAETLRCLVEQGYAFAPFTLAAPEGKTVFLRHDIDYSLTWALETAKMNAAHGIKGTFFLQLRCELYNLLSFNSLEIIHEIHALGQYFGFHYVIAPQCRDRNDLEAHLRQDYALFQQAVPWSQPIFAWHNPGHLLQAGFAFLREPFDGFINAYGAFAGGQHPYYADSNCRYTPEEILAIIRRGEPVLQLALAPMQWQAGRDAMPGILGALLVRKVLDCQESFLENDVFRALHPNGIPVAAIRCLEASIAQKSPE